MRTLHIGTALILLGFFCPFSALSQLRVFPEGYLRVADLGKLNPGVAAQVAGVLSAVVHVHVLDPLGNVVGRASGIIVGEPEAPTLRTAFHVVKPLFSDAQECQAGNGVVEVSADDGEPPEVLTCAAFGAPTSPQQDIATLKVSRRWKPLPLQQPEKLDVGDAVLLVGFPEIYSTGPVVSLGHILLPIDQTRKRIATTASASPGLSGAVALKVDTAGRVSLLGHVVKELNAPSIVRLHFNYRWGAKALQGRGVCLSQDGLNGVLYNGSRTDVPLRTRAVMTTNLLLARPTCAATGWKWSDQVGASLRRYRELLGEFDGQRPAREFSARYLALLQSDPLKGLKYADFPLDPSAEPVPPELFRASVARATDQLVRFQAKLDRVRRLYPASGLVDDWLRAIGKLSLKADLSAVNDHFFFGLGIIQLW